MNNTKYLFIAFVSILSLILWGSSAFAQGDGSGFYQSYPAEAGSSAFEQQYPEGTVGINPNPTGEFPEASSVRYQSMGWDTFRAGWLIGHSVDSPVGGELGQIEDLMIDRSDGHVALVILSGVQGFGAKFVAAPFSALERIGENTFRLNFGDQYTSISGYYEDPYAYQLGEYKDIVGLSTIPSSIDPLWADSVYRFYGQTPYWTEGKTPHPDIMSYRTARPSILQSLFMGKTAPVLMGATLQSKDGKAEARIEDFVIDSKDGRVAFLVLGRIPGRGDTQVAIPFRELSFSGNAFVLNTTGDRLAAAPSFNESADMGNREYAARVYGFFGVQPYWTDEEMY
jgi:sporulation protein YlmC with PRC-barrel domain